MVKRSEAIKNILIAKSLPDLAAMYTPEMEVQVNVRQGTGERVFNAVNGRTFESFSDGFQTWAPFRIPLNTNTVPDDNDYEIKFDLAEHVEGIGMTGWNWKTRESYWFAYDFDAITGHSQAHNKKLTQAELDSVKEAAASIPWVTIRRSTSGNGIHLYVRVLPVLTMNHTEHAALSRSVLGYMSALAGFNFLGQVDNCGGNMWVYHRKMEGTRGLELLKQGEQLEEVPENWRDHIKVVNGNQRKTVPSFAVGDFNKLSGELSFTALDEKHRQLIEYLQTTGAHWYWEPDHNMLVTHTVHLAEAHRALFLKGPFNTVATGKDRGHDQNCFAFPLSNGAWIVRRFTPGVTEDRTWDQDAGGWTYTIYNREPDLRSAARSCGGVENTKGEYIFTSASQALEAALMLNVDIQLPIAMMSREAVLKRHPDGRLVVSVTKTERDGQQNMSGWVIEKKNWVRLYNANLQTQISSSSTSYDNLIRHIVSEAGEDLGWVLLTDGVWMQEPLNHIQRYLQAQRCKSNEVAEVIGGLVGSPWVLVNIPFSDEYPGGRRWNKNCAKLTFAPSTDIDNLSFPSWESIFNHIGSNLDSAVSNDVWCRQNGIFTGANYLMHWAASMLRAPFEPLPYLFLWGNQTCGKSVFHEALSLLFDKGFCRAEYAITNNSGFNGEMQNAVLCAIEEIDLRNNKTAANRIKDWVTSLMVTIRNLYCTPILLPNTTHWVQCSNDVNSCPVFAGDTRVTFIHVDDLPKERAIPKRELMEHLRKEAPDFLAALMLLDLPKAADRLALPVIETSDKRAAIESNSSSIQTFFNEHCYYAPGRLVKLNYALSVFREWAGAEEASKWTIISFGKEIPLPFVKGKATNPAPDVCIGNLSFTEPNDGEQFTHKLELDAKGFLRKVEHDYIYRISERRGEDNTGEATSATSN